MNRFSWVKVYNEIGHKILEYKNSPKDLANLMYRILKEAELITSQEKGSNLDNDGTKRCKYKEIDPISFMNRFDMYSNEKRKKLISIFQKHTGMKENIPTDFDGIPSTNPQASSVIRFEYEREKDDIRNIWNLFEIALQGNFSSSVDMEKFIDAYDKVIAKPFANFNISIGLFKIRPTIFLNLDNTNRMYIKEKLGIKLDNIHCPKGEEYLELIKKVKKYINSSKEYSTMLDFSYAAWINKESPKRRYWLFAPGENAMLWDDCIKNGIISLGWDEIGDLNQYKTSKDIYENLKKIYAKDNPKNDKCALEDFKNNMKIGDIIIVKKGIYQILGYGKVESDYYYDNKRKIYKHIRNVKWIKTGEWNVKDIEGEKQLVQKTLTDITPYGKYAEKLLNFMKDEPVMNNSERQYFWLNANPRIWSFSELKIGEIIEYTAVNENGNKRQVYANYLAAKKGDLVIAYESTPVKAIVGLCEIDGPLNKKAVLPVRKLENLVNPIPYKEFSSMDQLKDMEYLRHPQGSLFKLEEEEYEFLMDMIRENNPIDKNKNVSKYSKNDFNKEVFFDDKKYDEIVDLLLRKKNIILQGAPGVGKTYIAKKLVYSIIGEKNEDRIASVQFHQSYSYEDFIEGYRPTEDGGFELSKGIFYNFCKKAGNDLDNKYFFVIDEINRGNLSKIFGELLVLIESDKRNEKLSLAYSSSEKFHVPENVYIIGLMNTADRSLAIMDYALRRRFAFFDIEPIFDNKRFVEYQKSLNDSFFDKTIENMKKLNKEIENDSSLGKGFEIGHSYFCNLEKKDLDKNIKSILKYEIIPMIEEYWFDNKDKYEEWKKQLLGE